VYEALLAVPVIQGRKTENEKFPGGLYTTTVEAFVPTSGRGIQAATSHCLGQNFSKMFDIQFENEDAKKGYAWQNSWGLTTRSIGVMTMIHGDNKGLVLPPRVAPIQAVIVPIFYKDKDNQALKKKGQEILELLNSRSFRVHFDDRDSYNPGYKYNHWEMKGVPVRLELGPRDLEKSTVCLVRRDTGHKELGVTYDDLPNKLSQLLDDIHNSMFEKAKQLRDESIEKVTKWEDFVPALDQKKMVLAPWCKSGTCEDEIKAQSATKKEAKKEEQKKEDEEFEPVSAGAKSLCIPFEQPELVKDALCVHCKAPAQLWCLFGRSY